jgi:hypothetical protein
VYFEPNTGQAEMGTAFVSRAGGFQTHLRPGEIAFSLPVSRPAETAGAAKAPDLAVTAAQERRTVRMRLVGASPDAEIKPGREFVGKSNYFRGQDASKWITDVPHYGEVSYSELLPGIDLVLHGNSGQLEYDFVVAPGADHSQISIAFEGADEVRVGQDGSLEIAADGGVLRHAAPVVFQESGEGKKGIRGGFVKLSSDTVGFDIGGYDPALPLVIDPVLTYSSYFGGSSTDLIHKVTIDGPGSIYVAGFTSSSDFPLVNPYDSTRRSTFVSKFDSSGSTLIYSTFVGGSNSEAPYGISVDPMGVAHVIGYTFSVNFPLVNAFQSVLRGPSDAYVFRLGPGGNALLFSTYLGGNGQESTTDGGVAAGADGASYVTGTTPSGDFPVFNPLQPALRGNEDVFVAKFDASGTIAYSTYLGGGVVGTSDGDDLATDIAVDSGGNAYIAGWTSNAFPTTPGAFQTSAAGGPSGFVTKFNPSGSALVFSTLLHSAIASERIESLAIDSFGNCYVTGNTSNGTFPVINPVQAYRGHADAFVTKFNSEGSALVYSTFLGGSGFDYGRSISIDASGAAYVAGDTFSLDFPVVSSFQSSCASCSIGREDAFVARLAPSGASVSYSSFLGGSSTDNARDNAVTADGRQVVVGKTISTDFPTAFPSQALISGSTDGFITIVGPSTLEPDLALSKNHIGNFVAGANGVYTSIS